MTKRSKVWHWAIYTGALRIACGKREAVGGAKLNYTTDRKKVTCKTCVQRMSNKPTRPPTHEVEGYASDGDFEPAAKLAELRMQYAGAVGLLCELSPHLSCIIDRDDYLNSIELAAADFCRLTGWSYRRVVHRIEVFPPAIKGANEHGKSKES